MKKYILISLIILLCGITGAFYLLNKQKETYQIVELKGAQSYYNFSKSNLTWTVSNNKDGLSALPVFHKDLVAVMFNNKGNNEDFFIYQYLKNDGNSLEFSNQHSRFLLNDKIITVRIDDNNEIINWLGNISFKELENLRSIIISKKLPSNYLYLLKKISDVKPDIGILIEDEIKDVHEILKMFNQTWLVVPDLSFNQKIFESIRTLNNLELLYIDGSSTDIDKLLKLPKLTKLIITNLSQPQEDTFFKSTKKLRSLSIIHSKITNIKFLNNFSNLTELNLIECNSLVDISNIHNLTNLKVINLTGCDKLQEISKINQLPSLLWFSFPEKINQKDFKGFIKAHKNIEVLELIGCKNIQHIDLLKQLNRLYFLSINNMDIDINSLFDLQELKYLSISKDILNDPAKISKVQNNLPNTTIIPNAGVCLGSGWLLLIIPIIIVMKMMLSVFKRIRN
ncbi:MAG: leucine-rich repeat domain-containing protein [Thermodesulfobacteriota bacterium]|nr:leucine-rich repeat domain-containing protein [Thermodesulfobacteriota bacterium]